MNNNTSEDLGASFTLDPTGTLNDLRFIVLSYYADDKTDDQVGIIFGRTGRWALKYRDEAINALDKYTLWGAVNEAYERKIFTPANRSPQAAWRKMRFYYFEKKFYIEQ